MKEYIPKIHPRPAIEKVKLPCSLEELYGRFCDIPDTAFLNSSLSTDAGRFSFIGVEPLLVIRSKKRGIETVFNGHTLLSQGDPFSHLNMITGAYRLDNPTPLPFIGGAIGYFSYDLKDILEKLPHRAEDDLDLPDMYFVFYRALLIHDKKTPGDLYISVLDTSASEWTGTSATMKEIKRKIAGGKGGPPFVPEKYHIKRKHIDANFTRPGYIKAVRKVIDYIYAGDIYQACLSQRFNAEWPGSPYGLYLRLNEVNPAPFSAYLNFEKSRILSSSPELFLRVAGDEIETRPMKGTRHRGASAGEDRKLRSELKKSEKDDAELSMIVDLERNDLGKISAPGTVEVAEHRRIEAYPTVFQTISRVTGRLKENMPLPDIVRATFPGGSISGCPKIRSMEIIDELEPTRRNVYTGSIGYISLHGTMELNIAIRTMIMKKDRVFFQAGGGIVADSVPEDEYRETLDKAYALIQSLKGS